MGIYAETIISLAIVFILIMPIYFACCLYIDDPVMSKRLLLVIILIFGVTGYIQVSHAPVDPETTPDDPNYRAGFIDGYNGHNDTYTTILCCGFAAILTTIAISCVDNCVKKESSPNTALSTKAVVAVALFLIFCYHQGIL